MMPAITRDNVIAVLSVVFLSHFHLDNFNKTGRLFQRQTSHNQHVDYA